MFYAKEKRRERELYAKEKESIVERRESKRGRGKEKEWHFCPFTPKLS